MLRRSDVFVLIYGMRESNPWSEQARVPPGVRKRTYARRRSAHPQPMKTRTMLPLPGPERDEGGPNDSSAEALVHREIAKLAEWLAGQGIDLQSGHTHADESSRDRLYLRYGYFMGLKNALAMLTNRGETLH